MTLAIPNPGQLCHSLNFSDDYIKPGNIVIQTLEYSLSWRGNPAFASDISGEIAVRRYSSEPPELQQLGVW